jgi:hypothetical protein
MSSVFDLPKSVEELGSLNDDMTRVGYQQVSATRDVTKTSFPNGTQHYKFTTGSTQWWIPARSYFRMRLSIKNGVGAGAALTVGDGIAPNMGICANLFQSAEIRLQGKTISRIGDFLPQIDALETRLSKSKSYLDSTGASLNLWQPSVAERQTVMANNCPILNKSGASQVTKTSLAAPNQVAVVVGGVFTFTQNGGVAIPDLTTIFSVGDTARITVVGGLTYTIEVAAVGAATLTSSSSQAAVGATNITSLEKIEPVSASRAVQDIELIWTPPLALMKHDKALPQGAWEIVLTPHNSSAYQKYAIESIGADKTAGTGNDFQVSVDDVFFYCATVEGKRFEEGSYMLDLDQTSCQVNTVDQTTFGQKDFTVSPSTYALTCAYQDGRVGTNSLCSSTKFKSYNAGVTESTELKLTRLFINYNSQNFPQPDSDPAFDETKDYTAQRYTESQIASGCMFDTGGCETIQEYHDRGAYYHFRCPQDAGNRATRVIVHQGFATGTDLTNNRLLLFSHSKSVMYVSVKDGQVLSVDVEEM